MSLFEDSFADTSGTVLTSHTPTSIASNTPNGSLAWATSSIDPSPIVSNANRARVDATSESRAKATGFTLTTDDYDVDFDVVLMSISGTGMTLREGAMVWVADDDAGSNYGIKFDSNGNGAVGFRATSFKNNNGNAASSTGQITAVVLEDSPQVNNTISAGDSYHMRIEVRVNGSNSAHRDIAWYCIRNSDGNYLKSDGTYQAGAIAFDSTTDTTSVNTGGDIFLGFYNTPSNTAGFHVDNFVVTNQGAGGGPLTAGTPIAVCTDTDVTVYCDGTNGSTASTGGAGGNTYQWHVDTTPQFTPAGGNAIGGATSENLTVSSPTTTLKFYKRVVTDSAATSETSVEAPGRLLDGALNVLLIADSINVTPTGNDVYVQLPPYLVQIGQKLYSASVFDSSASGSGLTQWLPDTDPDYDQWPDDADPDTNGTPLIDYALGLCDPDIVCFRLGTNHESADATTYGNRLTTVFNYIIAAFPSVKIIVDYIPYGKPGGSYSNQNDRYQGYLSVIASKADGVNIFLGNTMVWDASAIISGWRGVGDDIHPSALGARYLSLGMWEGIRAALNPESAGGSSGGLHLGGLGMTGIGVF